MRLTENETLSYHSEIWDFQPFLPKAPSLTMTAKPLP